MRDIIGLEISVSFTMHYGGSYFCGKSIALQRCSIGFLALLDHLVRKTTSEVPSRSRGGAMIDGSWRQLLNVATEIRIWLQGT